MKFEDMIKEVLQDILKDNEDDEEEEKLKSVYDNRDENNYFVRSKL
jgi:hypothetical protein